MTDELRLKGGTVLNRVWQHPIAAGVGAILTAVPLAAISGVGAGTVPGMFMGLMGIVIGAPVAAMIAEDRTA